MAIPQVLTFDENKKPVEGTQEFRANASYVWGRIPAVINSWNSSIFQVNGSVESVSNDRDEALRYRNDALNYKNNSESARNRAESAAKRAEAVVIPNDATYSFDDLESALNGLLTQSVAQQAQISILKQG